MEEKIKKMIHDLVQAGQTPKTILLTPEDASKMNIPLWTRNLFGMKCIIAGNIPNSMVTANLYETVEIKNSEDQSLH